MRDSSFYNQIVNTDSVPSYYRCVIAFKIIVAFCIYFLYKKMKK